MKNETWKQARRASF